MGGGTMQLAAAAIHVLVIAVSAGIATSTATRLRHGLVTQAGPPPLRVSLKESGHRSSGAQRFDSATPAARKRRFREQSFVQVTAEEDVIPAAPPAPSVVGTVFVGTPAREFSVAFDTGSRNVLLPSSLCASYACTSHNMYAEPSGAGDAENAELDIANGKVIGHTVVDKICLGPEEAFCANSTLFVATAMPDEPFALTPYDGILGLGPPPATSDGSSSFLGSLAGDDSLVSRRFAIWLARLGDAGASEFTFGGYSAERIASSILWLPLSAKAAGSGMWQVGLSDVHVSGAKVSGCDDCEAALDTGTGVIAGPGSFIGAVKAVVNVQEDCSNFDSLPLLGFRFGHVTLHLEPDDYVLRSDQGCFDQFLVLDLAPPMSRLVLLGSPFLRRYFTIYDPEALRVGMALAKHTVMSSVANETLEDTQARLMQGMI